MKNYHDLSPKCKYNRVMKIAEEIGQDDWNVYEDGCLAWVSLNAKGPDMGLVSILRMSILLHAARVNNERWERLLGAPWAGRTSAEKDL